MAYGYNNYYAYFAEISLIGIWAQTILFGINCILFAGAIFVVVNRQALDITGRPCRPAQTALLTATVVFFFALATSYSAICLRQLMEGFIWAPPGTSIVYFAAQTKPLTIAKLCLSATNMFACNIFLAVFTLSQAAASFTAIGVGSHLSQLTLESPSSEIVRYASIISWATDVVATLSLLVLIVARMSNATRSTAHLRALNICNTTVFPVQSRTLDIIIDCGAISCAVTIATASTFFCSSIVVPALMDGLMQIVVSGTTFKDICDLSIHNLSLDSNAIDDYVFILFAILSAVLTGFSSARTGLRKPAPLQRAPGTALAAQESTARPWASTRASYDARGQQPSTPFAPRYQPWDIRNSSYTPRGPAIITPDAGSKRRTSMSSTSVYSDNQFSDPA
ncbi:hypothetical protein FISHEDRAFT_69378 [Fistulina hepatica ATCC 64428]|uniref:Uncharacterized protein n=1 Tax=Fistulina hepatica ATCC 64428 TaxID=1128425 RepID=A0A0D7AM29_9AGAR|nr:hypothetical protein FISHEDRAFT_69378 [Fistulina hepatica ATCC 64428]